MTTIAYKDGIIAYDSRITSGGTIESDSFDKKVESDGVIFFFSGGLMDREKAIEAWRADECEDELGFSAIVVDDGGLVWSFASYDGPSVERLPMSWFGHMAIGSGADHAITAMDCGLSAKEAVKMAAKRDVCTGGRIRTYKVK